VQLCYASPRPNCRSRIRGSETRTAHNAVSPRIVYSGRRVPI